MGPSPFSECDRTKVSCWTYGPISHMHGRNTGPIPIRHLDSHDMTILRVPTTKCPIFLSLPGTNGHLSLPLPLPISHPCTQSTTFCSFTYVSGHHHISLRFSLFLINPRTDYASENLPLNFCRRMSYCVAESQRYGNIGVM